VIPALPAAVGDLLARCLTHDPAARPRRMGELADSIVALHPDLVGEPYRRPRPAAAVVRADGLCNQALSLLDLGQEEQAEQLWEQALEADPHHLASVYDQGLHRWRSGRIGDDELTAALEAARERSEGRSGDHLLALVHLERGDAGAAHELLSAVARRALDDPGVHSALAASRQRPALAEPVPLRGHGRIEAVALSADGQVAVAGGAGRSLYLWDTGERQRPWTDARHDYEITAVAVSADGGVVLAGDRGGSVRVWRRTEEQAVSGRDHPAIVGSVAIGPDGRTALSAGVDGSVHVWDVETGQPYPVPAEPTPTAGRRRGIGAVRPGRHGRSSRRTAGPPRAGTAAPASSARGTS
jgi:hypothetical protein